MTNLSREKVLAWIKSERKNIESINMTSNPEILAQDKPGPMK